MCGNHNHSKTVPMIENNLTDEEKIEKIKEHFAEIMTTLWLDLTDDSLKDTPKRVAKMYVKEVFRGLNEKNFPSVSTFENKYEYDHMLVVKDIKVQSHCEHHFVPFLGKAHVAYIPNGRVVWLSKINRIVDFYCRMPQVQERLTELIHDKLCEVLGTKDVAVVIEAKHLCVSMRGVKDTDSSTVSTKLGGSFKEKLAVRNEFLARTSSQ